MKRFIYKLTILILTFNINCSSTVQIKQKPDKKNTWELCPGCDGYGTIASLNLKKSPDDVTNNPNNKYACCLMPVAVLGALSDDNFQNNNYYSNPVNPRYEVYNPENNQRLMRDSLPQRSKVEKRVKCPLCNGKGWRITENTKSPTGANDARLPDEK